jgi:hypothetical protein
VRVRLAGTEDVKKTSDSEIDARFSVEELAKLLDPELGQPVDVRRVDGALFGVRDQRWLVDRSARREYDRLDAVHRRARLKHALRAPDVNVNRLDRVGLTSRNEVDCGEVIDRIGAVILEARRQHFEIANIERRDLYFVPIAGDVLRASEAEVVDHQHARVLCYETPTERGTDEAAAAGDRYTSFAQHPSPLRSRIVCRSVTARFQSHRRDGFARGSRERSGSHLSGKRERATRSRGQVLRQGRRSATVDTGDQLSTTKSSRHRKKHACDEQLNASR